VKHTPHFGSGNPDIDSFDEKPTDHRAASYQFRHSSQTDIYPGNSVPPFDDELDPSEFVTPLLRKRRTSLSFLSSRILAGVCAAAAVAILVALFSSDASRNFYGRGSMAGSMATVVPALSAAAQSDRSQLTARDRQQDPARSSPTENQTPDVPSVTTAAAAPAREEIRMAYQSALQVRTPPAAAVAEPTTPEDAVRRLDPDVVAALLKRADALIASGDVAAARLVLRRAADAGDARAAMTLAGTYDPAILEKLDVHGFVPDLAMARSWYEKAKKFGSAEAPQRLEMLASKRQ
jgi:cytoskeletal protein RodZ